MQEKEKAPTEEELEPSPSFGPRPFTMEPDPKQIIEVTSEYLQSLSDSQLEDFLRDYLLYAVKQPGALPRHMLMQTIMSYSMSATNY